MTAPSALRKSLLWAAKLALAVGLIWWVIDRAGWSNIQATLSNINPAPWALAAALILAAACLSALRWWLLMRTVGLLATPWHAIRVGFIGNFFNMVLPGLTGGDVVRAVYIAKDSPGMRATAVMTVAVDRVIGVVALAVIAAVAVLFDLDAYVEVAVAIYGFLAMAVLGSAVVLSRRARSWVMRWRDRKRGHAESGGERGVLAQLDAAVSTYRDRMGTVFGAFVMSFGVQACVIASVWMCAEALTSGSLVVLGTGTGGASADGAAAVTVAEIGQLHGLGLAAYCSLVPIIMMVSALPIVPAGWGVGEAAFVHFFGLAGVTAPLAVSVSLTVRLTAMLGSLLGGVFLVQDRKPITSIARTPDVESTP